jgi:hypothetical protein
MSIHDMEILLEDARKELKKKTAESTEQNSELLT